MDLSARARLLLGQAEQMAEALAVSLWERVPGYEDTALDRAELLDTIRASVRGVLTCLIESRMPSEGELEPARVLGERRAIQGVPIESVVASWHNAERFFGDRLMSTNETMTATEAREAYRQVARLVDRMTEVAVTAYRDVNGEVQAQFSQASADIVSSLAGVEPLEPRELGRRARLVGVEPDLPHRVIALGSHRTDGIVLTRARRMIAQALRAQASGRILAGGHQGHELLVLADPVDVVGVVGRAMNQLDAGKHVMVGIGEPRPRLAEASGSLREAISALRIALLLGQPIVRFVDVVPEVLLQENPSSAQTMVQAVLGPIDQGDLLATLEGFLSCGLSVRATARRLHVHENTVSYRVKRIIGILDLESVNDLVRSDILLALRARELLAAQR